MNRTQTEIAELLLDSGASVTVTNTWKETPLHIAVQTPNTVDVLKIMVSKGANVNATDEFQVTPLHIAAGAATPKNVEFLLANGANVNSKDADGYTPLDYAEDMALDGYPTAKDVVALLKRNGGRSNL